MRSVRILAALALLGFAAAAQERKLPVIKSNVPVVTIKDGETLRKDGWTLAPGAKPDVYEAALVNGRPHRVTFITDVDSISFMVEEGKHYDFIIKRGEDLCHTRIVGTRLVPAAVFDRKYQAANRGKITVEIPEVYELVNVAIAMTPTGIADKNLVYQNSEYYARVRRRFDGHRGHPLLAALDEALKKNPDSYFSLKMNGYAFEFDAAGRVVQSRVYDRTGLLQPHVNFPYPQDARRYFRGPEMSERAEAIFRGNIVFTEINHGCLNPESDKYAGRIARAISNRDRWVDKGKGPGYYGGNGAFDEYMNWALVSLRIADYAPREEQDVMIANVDRMMIGGRGFPQFEAFDRFLVALYRDRGPGQTVADLYPRIIEWFEKNNRAE